MNSIPASPDSYPHFVISLTLAFVMSGCAVFGTVKGIDEKAADQGLKLQVLNLEAAYPGVWKKLVSRVDSDASTGDVPDVAYQSKKSSATLSLNSACRQKPDASKDRENEVIYEKDDLAQVSETLFMGFQSITNKTQAERDLPSMPGVSALQTTAQGKIQNRDIKLSAVVFQRNNCTYDVIYLSPAKKFADHLADYERFLSELRIP